MRNSKIAITGAAGMIGSAIVRHLNELGYTNLFLFDDLGFDERWKNLLGKRFIDIFSPAKTFDVLEKEDIDAVIHMGACSDTTELDANYLIENNFHFTRDLAKLALKKRARFIYASSAATYGDGKLGFSDSEEQLEHFLPLNMYGYSKHLTDLWMKREGFLRRVVALKFFNIFGPNEEHKGKMSSFLYKNTFQAKEQGILSLFKSNDPEHFPDGGQKRDFLYVKDAAKMTCNFLDTSHAGIYNIGFGKAITWNEMAQYLFDALGKKGKIDYIEMPGELHGKYQNFTCADMKKYLIAFPNTSFTDIKQAVEDYIQNHLLTGTRW